MRKENWPLLLSDYLKERKNMPFEWGKNDCMMFVSKCVERLTDISYYGPYSDYDDEETAHAVLEQNDGVVGIINKCLGHGSKDILKSGRGDVVVVKMPEITGGIVDDSGQRIAVVSKEGGLIRLPLSAAVRYWRY